MCKKELLENIIIAVGIIVGIVIMVSLAGFGLYEVIFASKGSLFHLITGGFTLILDIGLLKYVKKHSK